jgi:hypothetical protein
VSRPDCHPAGASASERVSGPRSRSVIAFAALLTALPVISCGSAPTAVELRAGEHSLTVTPGTEFIVTLQTVGPGEYSSPPTISAPIVRYEGVSEAGVAVPAGPTQLFRLLALSRGEAVIAFTHTGMDATIQDTVLVR